MDKYPSLGKGLVIAVIFLFIEVAVAPNINFILAKASSDSDFIEVTSQACGIKGFDNTTIKLTRQQYQNLQYYLVDFRTKLNRTTTKEEAVLIFNETVVELNKYGLLPKGMTIQQTQRLTTGGYKNEYQPLFLEKNYVTPFPLFNLNFCCLVAGITNNTAFFDPVLFLFLGIPISVLWYFWGIISLFLFYPVIIDFLIIRGIYSLLFFLSQMNPISPGCSIGLGNDNGPANGWLFTIGLLGIRFWRNDAFRGNCMYYTFLSRFTELFTGKSYNVGAIGFSGLKLLLDPIEKKFFYFGFAPLVHIVWAT